LNKRYAVFLYSKQFEDFSYPPDCPFKTERAFQVRKTLASMGLLAGRDRREVEIKPADRAMLETFHSAKYLDALLESGSGNWNIDALHMGIGGPDSPAFKGMYEYGALACGASVHGADMLLSGEADIAFNPSGGLHHAGPELAAGFCYLNDVAIACKHLASKGKKVLYIDIDVHHGDGVQNEFYDSKDVMTISLHESGKFLFPGTGFEDEIGIGDGEGYSVNVPLPPDTYNDIYLQTFNDVVVPLMNAFGPDFIVLELGADALSGDPLAHIKLTNQVYSKILNIVMDTEIPLLVSGGGGYHVENTVRAWSLAWSVMIGEHDDMEAMNFGLGGVMLESTDWMGGFQDRELPVTDEQKHTVDPEVQQTINKVRELIFPIHGIKE
jgi:acetoin utilization protein AcuC